MSLRLFVSVGLCLVALLGCASDPGRPRPDDLPETNMTYDFRFGRGSGRYGFNILTVMRDGRCTYLYNEGQLGTTSWDDPGEAEGRWMKATFRLTRQQLAQLDQLLTDDQFDALKDEYAGSTADGTQWFVAVRSRGRTRVIWCDNVFPSYVRRIEAFVRQEVLDGNRSAAGQATPTQQDQSLGFDEE